MSLSYAIRLAAAGTVSLLASAVAVSAEPARQSTECPVASSDVVSASVGAPATVFDPDFGVTVEGADTQCLFSAGGRLVLVRRSMGYFADSASGATPQAVDQLRQIGTEDLDYTSVPGIGDAALWATVRDRSVANQRMGVLISKQGADAYAIGVMDTPGALETAKALTQAVVDAQRP